MSVRGDSEVSRAGLSLGVKLAVATLAVLVVVAAVVFGVLTRAADRTLLEDKTHAAALVADLFAASATASLDFGDEKDIGQVLQNLRVDSDVSYAALFRDGGDAPVAVLGDPGLAALPRAADVIHPGSRQLADAIEMVRPVMRPDGTRLGVAILRFSLAGEQAEIAHAQRAILTGTVVTLAFTALLTLAVARAQIVRPLARLADGACRVQAGEHSVRVAIASQDEIGHLASAFNTMAAAVVDREAHLADAVGQLRELFDHMHQGIVVFGADGVARAAPSRQARVLFGPDLEGRPIIDLLYEGVPADGVERQAFMDWLPCAFETPASAWDEVARLAPSRVTREKDGARSWLELAWSPVLKDGAVDRVMLLVTDVTRARQIEQDAELREEQHAREMRVMRRLVAGGGQVFATFLGSAKQRLGDARTVLDAPSGPASWNELLMSVHTLRGEARTFELIELALACEAIERAVRQARDDAAVVDEAWKRGILAATATAESLLEHARELFVAASPIGAAVFDQMTVRRSDVRALEATADRAGEETRRLIVALVSRPFGECVTGLEAAATRWAAENEKRVRLRVEGQDARIPGAVASAVTAALPHLVRNAIAHGIEAPSRRRASLKDEVGTIAITATAEPFLVRVADDGKGLDTDAIRERARALGIPGDRPSLLAFAEGLSTAPQTTEIAGHGVGLAAVVHALAAVGCKVELRSNAGDGTEVSISLRDGT